MGCNDSRQGISDAEAALRSQEAMLLFKNQTVLANYLAICRYTRDNELDKTAFDQALTQMMVIKTNLGSSNTITDFYDSFMKSSDLYDAKLLKVLIVLLGSGTSIDKATILFEIYDPGFEMKLSRAKIAEMAGDIVNISVKKVEVLVTDAQFKHSGLIANQKYLSDLYARAGGAQDDFQKLVLKGQDFVSKSDFVEILSQPENSGWLSSSGVRKVLGGLIAKRLSPRPHQKVVLTGARPALSKSVTSPNAS